MAAPPPPPPPKGGLSLYDNLVDPNDPAPAATISSAPVLYNQNDPNTPGAAPAKKPIDPAFRFQPVRRPQPKLQKPKATFPKAIPKAPAPAAAAAPEAAVPPPPQPAATKSTLADWAATEEDEWRYGVGEKRQRGGRKKKKKQQQQHFETDWDDIYDPARPTNVEEYLRSDEKIDEVREWKALLYAHRKSRQHSDTSDDDDGRDSRPTNQFAPPPSYGFVPPPPQSPPSTAPEPPRPPPDDSTGEDAYARRLALSNQQPPPPPPPPADPSPPNTSATISRAPVRYAEPEPPIPSSHDSPPPAFSSTNDDNDTNENDTPQPRTNRPGQAGFAHRLMSKYGWEKGSGLGADSSGIVNPLRVQVEKRRRKADADGGGWAEPGGRGKIIGGSRRKDNAEVSGGDNDDMGAMSEVIVLHNMLDNMPDLAAEIEDGLGQEIGQECGEKYGRVERLYIDQHTRRVFIKFTNQVSALRAVNELKGRVFNGNTITPKFYNVETFESGVYTA